jgi:hypothetical protein
MVALIDVDLSYFLKLISMVILSFLIVVQSVEMYAIYYSVDDQ